LRKPISGWLPAAYGSASAPIRARTDAPHILGRVSVGASDSGFLTLGQHEARAAAQRAVASGRFQRTVLVHGPAGAGKGSFIDDLLALLFCQAADVATRPCNACRACRDARSRAHPDLLVGSPEAWRESRSTGESIVAAARRWLLEASTSPVAGDLRVVLIEGADRANEQIQNALLKALEEPAPRQMFILVADEPSLLLPTIRSRSQPLRMGTVSQAELRGWLIDRERLPADQADALARIAGGLSGRAIGYARSPGLLEWRRRTQAELLEALDRSRADRFSSARELLDAAARLGMPAPDEGEPIADDEPAKVPGAAQRAAAMLVVDAWHGLARDLLLAAAGRAQLAPSAQLLDGLADAAHAIGRDRLVAFIRLLDRIQDGLRTNAAPRLALEVAMLAWPTRPARPIAG
jgi:DNA polymerase III delta prime subunit